MSTEQLQKEIMDVALSVGIPKRLVSFYAGGFEKLFLHAYQQGVKDERSIAYSAPPPSAIAAEREACAVLCEQSDRYRGDYFAAKIRARGQQ